MAKVGEEEKESSRARATKNEHRRPKNTIITTKNEHIPPKSRRITIKVEEVEPPKAKSASFIVQTPLKNILEPRKDEKLPRNGSLKKLKSRKLRKFTCTRRLTRAKPKIRKFTYKTNVHAGTKARIASDECARV